MLRQKFLEGKTSKLFEKSSQTYSPGILRENDKATAEEAYEVDIFQQALEKALIQSDHISVNELKTLVLD